MQPLDAKCMLLYFSRTGWCHFKGSIPFSYLYFSQQLTSQQRVWLKLLPHSSAAQANILEQSLTEAQQAFSLLVRSEMDCSGTCCGFVLQKGDTFLTCFLSPNSNSKPRRQNLSATLYFLIFSKSVHQSSSSLLNLQVQS